jgi:hypothetical protein
MTTDTKIGTHSYAGMCDPNNGKWADGQLSDFRTFSVSVFEWVHNARNKPKRGKCKVRVIGPLAHPELVYAKAQEIIALLDADKYVGPKKVTVKS